MLWAVQSAERPSRKAFGHEASSTDRREILGSLGARLALAVGAGGGRGSFRLVCVASSTGSPSSAASLEAESFRPTPSGRPWCAQPRYDRRSSRQPMLPAYIQRPCKGRRTLSMPTPPFARGVWGWWRVLGLAAGPGVPGWPLVDGWGWPPVVAGCGWCRRGSIAGTNRAAQYCSRHFLLKG
jgi:hypothetical protein